MPGYHVTLFILPTAMVRLDPRVLRWRYFVSTPSQTFDGYDVWEAEQASPLPVLWATRLGTVMELYGEAMVPFMRQPPPWHEDPSAIVRRLLPMAIEYHFFRNFTGTVDAFYRDASMPAKFFVCSTVVDISDPLYWYHGRNYVDTRIVYEPGWDYQRPRL